MNKKLKNDGITLISLVITIIIMLILVGVSITLAVNGGLFEYAGNAVGDTKNAMKNEQGLIDEIINDYIKPNVPEIPEGLKVGDYVNYTPTKGTYIVANGENGTGCDIQEKGEYQKFTTETEENRLKWRVWSIDERTGKIELISETVAQAENPLYLCGADGYNHGVDILNDLCKTLYSNENGATARSINVEDINAKTTYKYKEYEKVNDNFSIKYEETKRLYMDEIKYAIYPNLYSQEKGYGTANVFIQTLDESAGLNDGVIKNGVTSYSTVKGSTDGNIAETDPYVTYTYYAYSPESNLKSNLGVNTVPQQGMINLGKDYWLASRCCDVAEFNACWSLRVLRDNGNVGVNNLLRSHILESFGDRAAMIRVIVKLDSNVKITKDLETQPSENFTYWDIEY